MLPIIILVERRGVERYIPSTDVEKRTIEKIVSRHLKPGSRIYTDGFISYITPQSLGFEHEWVKHSIGEYARGEVHINYCESRASILKPWLAVHRGVSKDNLDLYLSFFYLQMITSQLPTLQKIKLIVKA